MRVKNVMFQAKNTQKLQVFQGFCLHLLLLLVV